MPIDTQALINTLKNGIASLAKTTLTNYAIQAQSDGQNLLNAMQDDLKTWAAEFANGELKADELEDLVLGEKDTVELTALKQAGLAEIEADKFKSAVLNLIVTTITAAIKI